MLTMRHEGRDSNTYVGTVDWFVTTALFAVPLCLDYFCGARSWAAFIAWPVWLFALGLLTLHWSTALRSLKHPGVELWGWWAAAVAHVTAIWHIIAVIKDVQ